MQNLNQVQLMQYTAKGEPNKKINVPQVTTFDRRKDKVENHTFIRIVPYRGCFQLILLQLLPQVTFQRSQSQMYQYPSSEPDDPMQPFKKKQLKHKIIYPPRGLIPHKALKKYIEQEINLSIPCNSMLRRISITGSITIINPQKNFLQFYNK